MLSVPDSDPVWLAVRRAPISDTPVLSATIGIFLSMARIAALANFSVSRIASICRPIARTCGSSRKISMKSSSRNDA